MWSDERRKIARRCGAKHISKSKCTKHTMLGPLLEVDMSKKCTPLWHEAHFQVKSVKIDGLIRRSAWQAQGIPYLGKSKQNVRVLQQFQLRHTTFNDTTFNYTTFKYITRTRRLQLQLHYTNYMTLNYTPLHYATLHYTTLHANTLQYTTARTAARTTTITTLHDTTLRELH